MKKYLLAVAVAASAVSAVPAAAETIDFNSNQNGANFEPTVFSNGFRAVENLVEDGINRPMGTNVSFDGVGPSNGTVHLDSWTDNGFDSIWTLIRLDRATFSLNAFDFASAAYNGNSAASLLTLTGTLADNSTVSQSFIPVAGAFQTFTVSSAFSNVKFVQFDAFGFHNRAAYDNIVVNGATATGAVPEPATWALMTLGFGAVGFAMRRKKVNTRIRFA